jgi:hypothetical protein
MPRCWRRNVRRAPDDERRDALRRGGRRPHDRERGRWQCRATQPTGEVARPASLATAPAAAADDRVSSRSIRTAAHAGEKNSYSPGDALDFGWGAPGTRPILAHQDRAHPPASFFLRCMGRLFSMCVFQKCALRRCGASLAGKRSAGIGASRRARQARSLARAPIGRSRGLATSQNIGWIGFAAAEASRPDKSKACPARNLARKISAYCANEQDHQYAFV